MFVLQLCYDCHFYLLVFTLTGIIPEEHQALQVVAPSPDPMGNYAGGLINQVELC